MKRENFTRSLRMPYAPTAPLLRSGLIGPVTLQVDAPK
jgi:hypothetical protein